MDASEKEEILLSSQEGLIEVETKKCCSDCKTTKTPLWRSGPSGPKSLCNACGIRYRKRRPTPTPDATTTTSKNDMKKGKIGKRRKVKLRNRLNVNLMDLREKRFDVKRVRSERQWGEVERAALLLMALSCGAVFA